MEFSYSYLVLVLPLLTFLFLGLMGTRLSRKTAGVIGTMMMGVTAVIAYSISLSYLTSHCIKRWGKFLYLA